MTISAFATGTQTATIGTEHFISSPNAEGKFTAIIDLSNMVDGDVLELRAYQMVLTGGTPRVIDFMALYGAQPTEQLILEWGKELKNELTDTNALRYSIKQTHGTGRAFAWKVVQETAGSGGSSLTAADVWTYGTRALTDKAGFGLSAGAVQAIWDAAIASLTTAGSIGKRIVDYLDAAVSSRSSHSATDVWAVATRTLTAISDSAGVTTLLSRLTAGRATNLDNLDATVSSRSTYAGTDTAGVTTLLSRLTGGRATNLDNLDATVSSRLASAGYTTPPTAGQIADAVWDEDMASHGVVNSSGEYLTDAAAGGSGGGSTLTAEEVWEYATRTLTNEVSAADVWAHPARTITGGVVDTNNDKTGYSLAAGQLRVKKNQALNNFTFVMRQSADHVTPATGLSVAATRSIDGAAFAATSNPVTELGNGVYKINLAASDLNGDVITLRFTATGADPRIVTIVTQP